MVDMHAHGCPEPEVLAAYVDHGLSLAERARVETHLASCPECTALLAGVVRTVAEIAPALPAIARHAETPPPAWRRAVAVGAAAAAAVIAVLAAPSLVKPWLERDAGLVSLAGSVGEHRSVLGRLTGGFPHAPLEAESAGGQDVRASGTDRVLLTAGRIRESVGEMATPSRLHDLGVAQLLARRYDDAAELLQAASRQQPANARYLNDVATVQLERARLGLQPDDLPRALAAADRARRLDPSLQEAWFNRALALSALQLTDQAKAAWTEYLRRDSASPWADEARKRLEDLSKPTPAEAWAAIEGRLQQQIDPETADAAVRAQTTEARNYIENTLLVAWADAVLAGGSGDSELDRIKVMADAMLRVAGDAIYIDATTAIRHANSGALKQLAQAHKTYALASDLFNRDAFADAAEPMTEARDTFVAADSSFRVLADIYLAAIEFLGGRPTEADRKFESVLELTQTRGYVYAAARSTWFRGLIAYGQGRIADAQQWYGDTLSAFERMGDVEQGSMAHVLLSGVHYILGNRRDEWLHREAAFAGLAASRSPRFRYTILVSGAFSIRDEQPEAALSILDDVISQARLSGRDAAIVDGLAQRAATLHRLGRTRDAEKAVAEARAHLSHLRDESFRRLLEIPVLAVESDLLRPVNPAAAAEAAQRALDIAIARRERTRLPQLYLRVAKANIIWGNLAAAEKALLDGLQIFEETRTRPSAATGITALDESWQLYETAVQLAIRQGDYDRAFALAERSRTRSAAPATTSSLADAQRSQTPDSAIVALNQFDDELAIWIIRHNGTAVVRRPITKVDASQMLARQQDEIRLEASRPYASAGLFDEILRPVSPHLNGVTRINFVPDVTYQSASFAALFDRTVQQFTVERWVLTQTPTVSAHGARTPRRRSDSILLLSTTADPSIRSIARDYRDAEIAEGPDATRSRLLDGARTVVHVAASVQRSGTHPEWSQLKLSDEPNRRHSGAVAGREIASRQFTNTNLVVLEELTERSDVTAGSFDLATAFLAAGVHAVLGTLPGANERDTRELMAGFHRQLAAQVPAAEALARVQRNAMQQNGRRLGAWTALVLYGSDR